MGRTDWGGEREREGERWGGEIGEDRWGREVGRRDGGERWEGEREGERGRVVILLLKEVCEGQ